MGVDDAVLTRKCKVAGIWVEMIFDGAEVFFEWDPRAPDRAYFLRLGKKKTKKFMAQYTRERSKFVADVASLIGGTVAVVDIGNKGIENVTAVGPDPKGAN